MSLPAGESGTSTNPVASASLRDLADLARAGSIILRQPLMQVTYEVHHVTDRPGYLADYVDRPSGSDPGRPEHRLRTIFSETLTSCAHGLGLVIVTNTGVGVGSRRRFASVSQTSHESSDDNGDRVFHGTARPNPSFLYESAWRYEGLICVDPKAQHVSERHADDIRDAISEIAKIADACHAPILSLQAPAQVPLSDGILRTITSDREEETMPGATSLAVRFSMALQHPNAETVLRISDDLSKFSHRRGFSLWLEDTRLGSRTGNWFQVSPALSDSAAQPAATRSAKNALVRYCIPVTLVGPARVGSTDAIISFLGQQVGITACSITSLDDLLFVHLQLCFADMPTGLLNRIGDQAETTTATTRQPYEALVSMLRSLGFSHFGDSEQSSSLMSHTGDYQCLIGPAREVTYEDQHRRMAIWFSWQTQGVEPDLAIPLAGLFRALTDIGLNGKDDEGNWVPDAPNIDYLICRNMGNSIFRGKGKLTIERDLALQAYPRDGLESRPTNLCVAIEEAWRARIARDGRHGMRELTVGWRECWLGHWSMPL